VLATATATPGVVVRGGVSPGAERSTSPIPVNSGIGT